MTSKFDNRLFAVSGASKSGTTWVQRVLDAHPAIRCHFQLPLFPPTRKLVGQLQFPDPAIFNAQRSPFKGVFETEEEEGRYWLSNGLLRKLREKIEETLEHAANKSRASDAEADVAQLRVRLYRGIAQGMLENESASLIGTKAVTDFELLFRCFPNARVIGTVRDGRDVVVSRRFHMQKYGVFYHGDELNRFHYLMNSTGITRRFTSWAGRKLKLLSEQSFRHYEDGEKLFTKEALVKFTMDWRLITEYILSAKERWPSNFFLVRYEELKAEPQTTLEKLFCFLETDYAPETLAEITRATDFDLLRKNNVESFFRKGLVGDWERHFSNYDKSVFHEYGGDLLEKLGYADSMWHQNDISLSSCVR